MFALELSILAPLNRPKYSDNPVRSAYKHHFLDSPHYQNNHGLLLLSPQIQGQHLARSCMRRVPQARPQGVRQLRVQVPQLRDMRHPRGVNWDAMSADGVTRRLGERPAATEVVGGFVVLASIIVNLLLYYGARTCAAA